MFLLARNWWSLVVRGAFAILLALVTFAWPAITLNALVLLFGIYAFVDGVVNLAGAWRHAQHHERWGASLLEGVAGFIAGVAAIVWPAITAVVLVTLIACWAIVTGILEIAAAVRLRRHVQNEWLLVLGGAASILFGVLLLVAPFAGALVLALWFGVYTLIFGVILVVLGFRLRSVWRRVGGAAQPATV